MKVMHLEIVRSTNDAVRYEYLRWVLALGHIDCPAVSLHCAQLGVARAACLHV